MSLKKKLIDKQKNKKKTNLWKLFYKKKKLIKFYRLK